MKVSLFATSLLCLVATVVSTCPMIDPKKLNIAPCAQCTANNFVDGNTEVCGYCYATKSCHEITVANMITGPCPVPPPTPASSPNADLKSETDPTYDYSLGIDGECDCRPEKYTNCSSCASLEHLGCSWISTGMQYRKWTVPVLGNDVVHQQDSWLNNTCQSILSPEVRHYELLNSKGNLVFSLDTRTEVWEYFWAQCKLSNAGFAYLMIGMFALTAAVCAVGCVFLGCYRMCCKKKRSPARQQYYRASEQPRASLLDANGRPVVIVSSQGAGRFA